MLRPMTGFHQDPEGHWVAELSCGHGQHLRHIPPFQLRPWVITSEGRAERLGQRLECVRCDRRELPEGFAPYQRTPEFTEATVPPGLLREHSLKPGVWGRLTVLEGRLAFSMSTAPVQPDVVFTPEAQEHIPPEAPHAITPLTTTRFFIEFCGPQPQDPTKI